ncbi:hypothetical protein [Flagellimonas zhangzhouensis]|uniref:Beta-lactamase-inhibitor-like, PepSY-like n=1 Tax=Flagellimonas zhangzhouensis TaxID=1073328 RepID=A0A1H2X2N1_9FLAO|nr:hypothetical protein [Allomuricauda zhangzhouensis]SDQ27438.1 hypothetical protein SAMN05216294_1182 [Allomuricauda zhangzhouensis]SDW87130.1 hypothetical protein SAMN04487892_2562 [Allomuricauda zhangzhouensis]
MKSLLILFFALCLAMPSFAQEETERTVELSEVTVGAANHTYLGVVLDYRFPAVVTDLENKAAKYDIRQSKLFVEGVEEIEVTFSGEKGHIIATYNQNGTITEAVERYYDITFPLDIRQQVYNENPGWMINKDAYVVTYDYDKDLKRKGRFQLMKDGKKKNVTIEF